MKGDATCTDVLACSLYYKNIVHIVLTVSENVKYNTIRNKVHSKIEKKTKDITFNHLNVIHMYNFGMGSVDVSDQRHMQYRPYHWIRNKKWWW